MANTTIQIKKSTIPGAVPANLANGELAINLADGKLFFKNTISGGISSFNSSVSSTQSPVSNTNSFATVNAGGTLLVATSPTDILTLVAGSNITLSGNSVTDTITISSTASGNTTSSNSYATIGYTIEADGEILLTGVSGLGIELGFNCNIISVTAVSDVVGNCSIDIWKTPFENYPPTSANSITGGNYVQISNNNKYSNTSLPKWTKTIKSNDVLFYNVVSTDTVRIVRVTMNVLRLI